LSIAGPIQITVSNPAPGGGTSNSLDFTVNNLNPLPTIAGITPSQKTLGNSSFTLTIDGTNFINSSVIYFKGLAKTTTFVSSTELKATILASDLNTSGTFPITVVNPIPGGGTSNIKNLTVMAPSTNETSETPSASGSNLNPVPVVTGIGPNVKDVGDPSFTLTVDGNDFIKSSVVQFNSKNRTTTFVSPTQLTAIILSSDMSTSGFFPITVFNPAPGGGTSTIIIKITQ